MTHQHPDDDGKVVPLHKYAQPSTELAIPDEHALEGEVVDYLEGRVGDYQDPPHPVIEHAAFFVAGVTVVYGRFRANGSTGIYDELIRTTETMGDLDKAVEVLRERRDFLNDRHARRFEWIELPSRVLSAWKPLVGFFVTLLVIGLFLVLGTGDPTQVIAPFKWVGALVYFIKVSVEVLWRPVLIAALVMAGTLIWLIGRNSAEAGEIGWLAHRYNQDDHEGDPITPSIVVTALRDLGIASLRKSVENMGDAGAAMLSPIVIAGCGVELEATLPIGTSTREVMDRGLKLAENLGRHEHEVFITIAQKARTLKFFIADSGALDEPIGPSPLLTDPNIKADYYTGRAPWGLTLRGDLATVSLYEQMPLICGKSNQGKTASLRALMLWLAFDPTVEFHIADLKGVGDWRMFDGLATTLIQGPTEEHCIAATHMVEAAVEEMNRRITALEESGSTEGITRAMAIAPGSGYHPYKVIVDEAQKAYMCLAKGADGRQYGGKKGDSRYFKAVRELKNQGRAVNVTLSEGTQDPTDDNLPKISREASHLRFALFVATKSQAAMALGEAPVEQGAAPHKLRDGLDRGTVIALGPGVEVPRGEPAVTIRTFFIDGKQATEIADRAKARRAKVLTSSGRAEVAQPRDLLDDLDEILADKTEKIRLTVLAGLLYDRFEYGPYQAMTGEELAKKLDGYGIKTTRPQNVLTLDPKVFRDGLQQAATGHREDR